MNIKKTLAILLVLIISISTCACTNNSIKGGAIEFTNLANGADSDYLLELLVKNDVDTDNAQKVIDSVNYYSETIGKDLLYSDGTIDLSSPIPKYDDIKIDEMWAKKNDMFIGYNCRLTAFELMKDFITVEDTSKSNPSALFMDEDALNYSKDNYFTDEELAEFEAMYSTITTTSSTDTNEQYEVQKAYWDSIGVKFNTSKNISLISVYIHNHFSEDENELIIGHTGVLMENKDKYIFFEKLSFQLPYQMITFNSKQELKEYLMASYDTDTTGESAKPFILENDKLL